MGKFACPICGDPNGFLFWIDDEPPIGCPHDETWHRRGVLEADSVKNVGECRYQRKKAWQAAEFRRLLPDAFDEAGTMRPGRLADVLRAFGAEHPNGSLII